MTKLSGSLGRRRFLGALGSLGAGFSLGACACSGALRGPDAAPPPATLVDIHAHVFNALDIPTYGFVTQAILDSDEVRLLEILEPLVWFITFIMDGGSPTVDQELAALEQLRNGEIRALAWQVPSPLRSALRRFFQDSEDTAREDERGGSREEYRAKRARFVRLFGLLAGQDAAALGASEAARSEAAQRLQDDAGPAADDPGTEDILRTLQAHVRWAAKFVRYRWQNVEEYWQLYGDASAGASLLAPALVDFDSWLRAEDPSMRPSTPLAKQVEVMAALAAVQPAGRLLHTFVAYDPRRDLEGEHPGDALRLVQDAVMRQGCIGVKLYPPMGFRALENGQPGLVFPRGPENPAGLDQRLMALYRWCSDEDVPIMAHCSPSNHPHAENAERADPAYWECVLSLFPTLRLNLSHFGGLWALGEADQLPDPATPDRELSWWDRIVRMIGSGRYPNLYADIGDFDSVLLRHERDRAVTARLHRYLSAAMTRHPRLGKHVLYGTDWGMVGREYCHQDYLLGWATQARLLGAAGLREDDFFRHNALNFLGFAGAESKVLGRLGGFHRDRPRQIDALRALATAAGS